MYKFRENWRRFVLIFSSEKSSVVIAVNIHCIIDYRDCRSDNYFFFAAADAYNHTDSEFLRSENNQSRDAGSTASTAVLVGDRLLIANVGDSRAVICRGGNGEV